MFVCALKENFVDEIIGKDLFSWEKLFISSLLCST